MYEIRHPYLNYVAVISYLQARKWRSTVLLNLSILALGAMIAKIVTNFVSGEPGLAGFRVCTCSDFFFNFISVEWDRQFWLLQAHISSQRPRVEVRPEVSHRSIFGREWNFCSRCQSQIRYRSTL